MKQEFVLMANVSLSQGVLFKSGSIAIHACRLHYYMADNVQTYISS